MKALDILIEEHAVIRQFLDTLHMAIERLEQGERPPADFFREAVDFARTYTDKLHHYKEEYIMFTKLAQKREGEIDAYIEALRGQHERGRNYLAEISNALDGYEKGHEIQTLDLLENAAAYLSLLRHHIHREDHLFYPMVKEAFTDSEKETILELFRQELEKEGAISTEEARERLRRLSSLL
jgi:hemerythrin-like domain-containing protein